MQKFKIVDLFAGAGGWSMGAQPLGAPVMGVERSRHACETRRAAGLATTEQDVRALHPSDFPEENVLVSRPPAPTLSIAGQGRGREALDQLLGLAGRASHRKEIGAELANADGRTELVLQPLLWALAAIDGDHAYEAIALAQVATLLPLWEEIGQILTTEGYSVACGVLKAEQYGVPQTRRVAVLVARLAGPVALPTPTHRAYRGAQPLDDEHPRLMPYIAMGEVLGRLYPFEVISNYGTQGHPWDRARRTSDQPAAAVNAKYRRCSVVTPQGAELPRLTDSEAGQLQGFPGDYPWSGQDVASQISNTVPPLLATRVLVSALDVPMEAPKRTHQIPSGE
ncbi:DNA cytosine methyltransferase [Streptomyces sp. NPDC051016]|uniref:DNA cytosine methyltransferase n=1 Tax=Streptomyces sp. NPDC051016 TaxID=3365638 RepID=UPI00378DE08C